MTRRDSTGCWRRATVSSKVTGKVVDVLIIDGVLNAAAFLVELTGDLLRFLQTGNVRNYALSLFLGLVGLVVLVIGFTW